MSNSCRYPSKGCVFPLPRELSLVFPGPRLHPVLKEGDSETDCHADPYGQIVTLEVSVRPQTIVDKRETDKDHRSDDRKQYESYTCIHSGALGPHSLEKRFFKLLHSIPEISVK